VAGSDSFINLTLNYLLHFTCMCVCVWTMSSMEQRQRAEKTMKLQGRWRRSANLVVWTSDNYSLSPCFIEFEWRVSHLKFLFLSVSLSFSLPSSFFFINNYSHMYIYTYSSRYYNVFECTKQTSAMKVKRIGTQQDSNLLGQRVVCQ